MPELLARKHFCASRKHSVLREEVFDCLRLRLRVLTAHATQRYCCLVIPLFEPETGNLPPGIHEASWSEVVARFGRSPHRLALLAGLRALLDMLALAGCRRVYIDGSFVTAKTFPADFDGCWEVAGVDPLLLDPVLLDFSNRRAAQKARYGGEMFLAEMAADRSGRRFREFFQQDKDSGEPKGIIAIDPGDES